MKRYLILSILVCLSCISLYGVVGKPFNYEIRWMEIDKLQSDGLPKSMAEKVDTLYAVAVRENRTDQQIKALIYQLTIMQQVEEFSAQKAIEKVQSLLDESTQPASSILHSMLAQLYWSYYQSNRWRFSQRSATIQFLQDDIATWDLSTITKATIKEYQLSLEQPTELQKYSIADFPALLYQGGEEERALRPTLFDFLAHRALDFYRNDESGLTLPFEEFKISDTQYFQPAVSFARMQITSPDSLSLKYHAALLYQELIRFHLNDADPSALIEVDLDRLEFVHNNNTIKDSQKDYEAALRLVQSKHSEHPASAYANYKLAKLLSWGHMYNEDFTDEHRWDYKNALELCQSAVKAYPESFGGKACKTLVETITLPVLDLTVENYVIPQAPVKALLALKNLSGVEVRIYRIPNQSIKAVYDEYSDAETWEKHNYRKVRKLLKKKPLWTKDFKIDNEGDFRYHSYELGLASLPPGRYIIIATNLADKKTKAKALIGYSIINSTNINYALSEIETRLLLIANRDTGAPISGATVNLYERKQTVFLTSSYQLAWSGTSDENGMVRIPLIDSYRGERVAITYGKDTMIIFDYFSYRYDSQASVTEKCLLLTDRSIYRPGQTIYLKGVLYESDGEKRYGLLPNKDVEVFLRDNNGQLLEQKKLKTNEFATFNCAFTAPNGVLTGQMSIRASTNTVRFNVEEYKRPRFEVTLEKPKETYKLNQYVTVQGKGLSYSGFPIDNATVSYRITRQAKYPYWFWWWGGYPSSPQKEIASGTLQTDANGEFKLTFLAVGDESVPAQYDPYFSFNVSVDITDISGETRSGSLSISIGEKELILEPVLADNIDLQNQQLTIPIHTTNLSKEPIPARGNVTISRLQAPNHVQKSRLWTAPDREYLERDAFLKQFPNDIYGNDDDITTWEVMREVWRGSFNTPEIDSLQIENFGGWEPGAYVFHAVSSVNQQEIIATRYFTVYDSVAKSLPYPMAEWFVPIKTVCEPGEAAQVLIGSGYSDVSVLMEVEKNRVIVDSQRFILDEEQRLLTFPVMDWDRGGFYVHFTWFRDGRFYSHNQEITVPWTNKELDFEYMTFRDKLLPGQEEEWRIKLKDHTGGKVTAEMLASMYDASLDAFISSRWTADVYGKIHMSGGWESNDPNLVSLLLFKRPALTGRFPYRKFDRFNWYWYGVNSSYLLGDVVSLQSGVTSIGGELHIRGGRANEINFSIDGMSVSDPVMEGGYAAEYGNAQSGVINIVTKDQIEATPVNEEIEETLEDLSGIQARVNLNETAFFYPTLRTDENGEVSFVFTVPEALTRWKFRALALTKDFQIGITENTTVTQKPIMVLPNPPRFFREGDKITFTTKITSLDETDQSGVCQLYLFDAISLEPVEGQFGLKKAQQPFSVKKGESTSLSWDLDIPIDIGAVTYRVVARAGDFSDGEENTLPILSNRMLITESLPLPVRGHSTKSFVFDKLRDSGGSSTLRHHKLTLEYTSNPAWYAIQALPYMMEYPYDCNEQIFSRFYANSLASHIANSNPRIKRVFDSWRDTPNSAALLSNLEKNQELKAVLLQETPWVLDAQNESQSKQRIALLFDLNKMSEEFNATLSALQKNQSPSGAWSWFPGMNDSWWVTQYIVEGFGHLDHLGVTAIRQDPRIWSMVRKAVLYLDREILQDYQDIKRYNNLEDDNLGYMEMHYLYARSYFPDIELSFGVDTAVDYFQSQANKYWLDKDLYGQGLIALALHRSDKGGAPSKIIASFKEKALHSEEMGMWWKNEHGWYWYQAPIETQSLLIEVFNDVARDTESIDEMRTWLLKQKQTTNWKTTKATAEACYALLISGTEWLSNDQLAEITIGGNKLDPRKLDGVQVEAGTGYFKTSWQGSDISTRLANISVTNPNDVSSWGSLYWQYFEDLDKITPADTPLSLKKQLFVERITTTGKVLEPIGEKTQLSIGDKVVVRIELRSDRDMEYVHMKDMRSAGFEPINVLSRYKWQDGLGYYEATGDAATNFFIDYLRKGTYVFEYPLRVFNKGDFSNGVTTIQCMYAPEFSAHSEGIRVQVK